MTSDAIRARNRSNARKSTGPKTARGKAAVAGNARKHGATSPPDPESVVAWLAIIRDDPAITAQDLVPQDDLGFCGLALAQAEAKLAQTERALRDHEADDSDPLVPQDALHEACQHMMQAITQGRNSAHGAELLRAMMPRLQLQSLKNDLHRRLKRYVAEARAQRRKALKAWIAAGGATPPRALHTAQNPKSRNKARFQLKAV
jgi:hypothetical protein